MLQLEEDGRKRRDGQSGAVHVPCESEQHHDVSAPAAGQGRLVQGHACPHGWSKNKIINFLKTNKQEKKIKWSLFCIVLIESKLQFFISDFVHFQVNVCTEMFELQLYVVPEDKFDILKVFFFF